MSSATPLTIMVTDQSPEWTFSPSSEGSSNTTWQSAWTGTPDSAYDPRHKANNIPSGSSSHVTTFSGASAQISFVGTRASVFGQGTAGAYTTTLDDGIPVAGAPSGSVLATYKDLDAHAKHTLLLKAIGTQPLALSYASIDLWPDVGSASVVNTTQVAVSIQGDGSAQTNSFYSTSGSGFSNQHNQDQGGYTRLDTNAAGAYISFTCTNSSAVFIYGTTNYNHGNLSVEINPAVGSSSGPRVLSGTSKWFVLDNLIYWESGLDPSTSYRVTLTNLNDGNYSDIHSVVLMNVRNTTSTSSVSASLSSTSSSFRTSPSAIQPQHVDSHDGKIAGITVGAVLGAIALLLAAFICLRRRYRRKPRLRSTTSSDGLVITPYKHTPQNSMTLGHLRNSSVQQANFNELGYGSYSPTATSSMQDSRGGMYSGVNYSQVPLSDDFNPYADVPPSPRPAVGGGHSLPSRKSGLLPNAGLSSSSRSPARQEVDAGRFEETLPPNYDPSWAAA